jgi:hypothetical protein
MFNLCGKNSQNAIFLTWTIISWSFFSQKNRIRHVTPGHGLQLVMKYGDLVEYLVVADVFLDYILQNCSVSVVSCDFIVTNSKVDCKCFCSWMHFVTGTMLQQWFFGSYIGQKYMCWFTVWMKVMGDKEVEGNKSSNSGPRTWQSRKCSFGGGVLWWAQGHVECLSLGLVLLAGPIGIISSDAPKLKNSEADSTMQKETVRSWV